MIDIPIVYRRMKEGEVNRVFAFIRGIFNRFVAPEFSQEGIEEFMKYIQPDALVRHLKSNHFALIASMGPEIIGIIAVRDYNHIALFFVDDKYQRKGIGRELLLKALEICDRYRVKSSQFTVNASPNSIDAYKSMGFQSTDSEQCVNGIRFIPMALPLPREDDG